MHYLRSVCLKLCKANLKSRSQRNHLKIKTGNQATEKLVCLVRKELFYYFQQNDFFQKSISYYFIVLHVWLKMRQLKDACLCKTPLSSLYSQQQPTFTSHTSSLKCVLSNFVWELQNSKVPSNVCQQESNCLMLMITIVQSNDHIFPNHLRNIFAVSFDLESLTFFCFV